MTASAKLRALDEAIRADRDHPDNSAQNEVLNAIPLIADCLEQQERLIFDNGTRSRQQMWRDSEAALLKLEATLDGKP